MGGGCSFSLVPVLVGETKEREVVGFGDFVRDDVVTVVVGVFELHHVASGHVGHRAGDDPVFAERSVHGGLGGDDVAVTLFERVHNMSKGFDTVFVRERPLLARKLTLDATGEDGTVGLESLPLQSDLVHDDSLLEVDLVVGFQSSVILESRHAFLGVSFRHRFLEEVDQTVGKVGEALESSLESIGEDSPGHGEFTRRAHPLSFTLSIGGIPETFTFDDERLSVDGTLDHGVEGKLLAKACCTGCHCCCWNYWNPETRRVSVGAVK